MSTATTIHITTTGGIEIPKVPVAGCASVASHAGALPLVVPPFRTCTTPTAIVPMASVTMNGWIL